MRTGPLGPAERVLRQGPGRSGQQPWGTAGWRQGRGLRMTGAGLDEAPPALGPREISGLQLKLGRSWVTHEWLAKQNPSDPHLLSWTQLGSSLTQLLSSRGTLKSLTLHRTQSPPWGGEPFTCAGCPWWTHGKGSAWSEHLRWTQHTQTIHSALGTPDPAQVGGGRPPAADLGALLDRPTAALLGVPTDLGHSPGRAHGHLLGGRRQTWANGLRAQAALKRSINVLGPTGYVSMELICQELSSLKELLRHQWGPGLQAGWGERREGTQVKLLRCPTCDSLVTFLSLNSTRKQGHGMSGIPKWPGRTP